MVNSRGVIWGAVHSPAAVAREHDSETVARCRALADRWIHELRIPFKDLPAGPRAGEVWGLNFCRQRRAGGKPELTSWSPTHSSFADPRHFVEAVFPPAPAPRR